MNTNPKSIVHHDCPQRKAALEGIIKTEALAASLVVAGKLPKPTKPFTLLRNLAIASVGGPDYVASAAIEILHAMTVFCCDQRFAPSSGSPFKQAELRRAAFRVCGPFSVGSLTALQARKLLAPLRLPHSFDDEWRLKRKVVRISSAQIVFCKQTRGLDVEGQSYATSVHTGTEMHVASDVVLPSPKLNNKSDEQLAAAAAFLSAYNLINGTAHNDFALDVADEDVDVNIPGVGRVQIVKALFEPHAYLARTGAFSLKADFEQLFEKMMEPIKMKSERYPPAVKESLILVLDGGYPRLPSEVVEIFGHRNQAELAQAGFAEIWYTSVPESFGSRLYPFAARQPGVSDGFRKANMIGEFVDNFRVKQQVFELDPKDPRTWTSWEQEVWRSQITETASATPSGRHHSNETQ